MDRTKLLEAFRALPTGNVADAMANLGMPCGVMVSPPPAIDPHQARMAGYAYTLVQMPRHQAEAEKSLVRHPEVIDSLAQPGDVVVMDVGGRPDVCSGGAMFALRAKMRGLAGFLVEGCLRDLNEIAATGLPVFCRGGCPTKSAPSLQTVAVDVPVRISGVQVRPGDVIVGDDTGVVVFPAASAEAILAEAQRIQRTEECVEKYIREGLNVAESRKRAAAEA